MSGINKENISMTAAGRVAGLPKTIQTYGHLLVSENFTKEDMKTILEVNKWIRYKYLGKKENKDRVPGIIRFIAKYTGNLFYHIINLPIPTRTVTYLINRKIFQEEIIEFIRKNDDKDCGIISFGAGFDTTLYTMSHKYEYVDFQDSDLPGMARALNEIHNTHDFQKEFGKPGKNYKYIKQDLTEEIIHLPTKKTLYTSDAAFPYIGKMYLMQALAKIAEANPENEFIFSVGITKSKAKDQGILNAGTAILGNNTQTEYAGDYSSIDELEGALRNTNWNINEINTPEEMIKLNGISEKLKKVAEKKEDMHIIHLTQKQR